jgi:quinol monooxygenase YgiN
MVGRAPPEFRISEADAGARNDQTALRTTVAPVTPAELARHFLRAKLEDLAEIFETLATLGRAHRVEKSSQFRINPPMQYVLIIHEVADYAAWKRVFDAAADIRMEAGERSYQVLKYQNDPNRIVHFSAWTSIEDARRFFESPKLIQIRAEAGVKSPDFIYLEQLEAGTL